MKQLARTPYMRNLWAVLTKFEVLPTNNDFRALSDYQIDMILYSMGEDAREMELARKGMKVDGDHYDSSFDEEVWNKDVGDWEVLKEGHDPDEIARQIEKLTREEDLKNLAGRFDGLDEYNEHLEAGGKTARETVVEQYINKRIAEAEEMARERSRVKTTNKHLINDREVSGELTNEDNYDLDKKAMDNAIALFNSNNDDDEYTEL